MKKNRIKTIGITCFCCKKARKGTVIDERFVCNKCNHLPSKDTQKKEHNAEEKEAN